MPESSPRRGRTRARRARSKVRRVVQHQLLKKDLATPEEVLEALPREALASTASLRR